jgi:hypothetical protein
VLVRGYKGKNAARLVTRIDCALVSLVAELRGHERRTAKELGQRKTRVAERKPLDVLAPAKACRWFASGFPRLRKPSSGRDRPRYLQPQFPRRGAAEPLGLGCAPALSWSWISGERK